MLDHAYYNELNEYSLRYRGIEFWGLMEGTNILSEFNDEIIEMLIDKGIYVKMRSYFTEEEYYYRETTSEFQVLIEYKKELYQINPIVVAELFCQLEYLAFVDNPNAENEIEKIFFNLNGIVGRKDKIKFLKKRYKKHFPKDDDYEFYSDLENDGRRVLGGYLGWYNYFFDYLSSESGLYLIKLYLSNEMPDDEYLFSELIERTLEMDRYHHADELESLFNKWRLFREKELILESILFKIEELENPKSNLIEKYNDYMFECDDLNELEQSDEFSSFKLSATEIAYYIFYKEYVHETVIDDVGLSKEKYWERIGEKFGKSGANIRNEHGKLLKDKSHRLQPTNNRVAMLEKILPLLSEKSKIHCQKELNELKLNL